MINVNKTQKTIFVFFTWDVSLSLWVEKGLFDREVKYYEALAQQGYDIVFMTWGGKEDRFHEHKLPDGIRLIPAYERIPHPSIKILRALFSFLMLWTERAHLRSSDIFKTNQMWGSWCAAFAALIYKKPLIARTGFELFKFTLAQRHGFFRRRLIYFISKFTYANADVIYVATSSDKKFVEQTFSMPTSKIQIRPNWIDGTTFFPSSIPQKENRLLFVGRLTHQKNLSLLFRALSDSDYSLDIIGDGELRDALQQEASQSRLNINFLGSVPNSTLPGYYRQCSIFVLPSLFEGNPKTLLEAMACGCAVVGTDSEGINNVIQHEVSGLLAEPTPQSLRTQIDRLTADTALKDSLGQSARQQIMATQVLEILIEKEIKDYESL